MNKNVADYTNFDGKTNKRIVQAPGGASSVSLSWGTQKTDYGPSRVIKKSAEFYENNQGYTKPPSSKNIYSNNQGTKLMEQDYQNNGYSNKGYGNNDYKNQYSKQAPQIQGNNLFGGQYGYNNYQKGSSQQQNNQQQSQNGYRQEQKYYNKVNESSSMYKPSSIYSKQPDQLDMAIYKQNYQKEYKQNTPQKQFSNDIGNSNRTGSSSNRKEDRPCIKFNAPQGSGFIIGDTYNYWKEDNHGVENFANKKPNNQGQYQGNYNKANLTNNQGQKNFGNQTGNQTEKTSVRVKNPPGGRSNFTLG